MNGKGLKDWIRQLVTAHEDRKYICYLRAGKGGWL
jgi:hypothetical protein